jgi:hypothetical protein
VSRYAVGGKPWPSSVVPRIDGLDQNVDDGVVQACIKEVHELVPCGALVEALGMRGGWDS